MGGTDKIDFSSWKIKQLQDYIRKHGGDPDDCEEKKDLVEKATVLSEKEKAKEVDGKAEKKHAEDRNYPAASYPAPAYGTGPPGSGGGYGYPAGPPGYYGGYPGAPYDGGYGAGAPPQYGAPQPPYYQPPQQQFPGGYGALPQGYGEPGRDYLGGFGGPPQYGPSPGQWGPPPQGQWAGPGPQGQYGPPQQGPYGGGPPAPGPYSGGPPGPRESDQAGPLPQQPQQQQQQQQAPTSQQQQPPSLGRKRALICACNYAGSDNALNGCINDAKCMHYMLKTRFGFREEDITMLTDDQNDPAAWPTNANMRMHMQRLVTGAQAGDSLIFHYSGHGSQSADWSGDEDDGMNETLCPCDFKIAGQIVDDDLNRLLVNPLPPGVRLHAIIDACHSGSVLDMEFRAEFRNGAPVWTNEFSRRPSVYKGTAGGEAFQFGAAMDSQTAADTSQLSGNVSTGAATFSFIQAIERVGTDISYGRLLDEMDRTLRDMGRGGGAGSGHTQSDPFAMGGLLGALLGQGLQMSGGEAYSNQTPVLSTNNMFDINRRLCI